VRISYFYLTGGQVACLSLGSVQPPPKHFHAVQLSEWHTPSPLPYDALERAGVILTVLVAEPLNAGQLGSELVISE
jgi:hypothetical protein